MISGAKPDGIRRSDVDGIRPNEIYKCRSAASLYSDNTVVIVVTNLGNSCARLVLALATRPPRRAIVLGSIHNMASCLEIQILCVSASFVPRWYHGVVVSIVSVTVDESSLPPNLYIPHDILGASGAVMLVIVDAVCGSNSEAWVFCKWQTLDYISPRCGDVKEGKESRCLPSDLCPLVQFCGNS